MLLFCSNALTGQTLEAYPRYCIFISLVKADQKAEEERKQRVEEERLYREEEMRDMALKLRKR